MANNRRVVIITGVSGIIGSKLALGFADDGWNVACAYNSNIEKANEVVEYINKTEGSSALLWKIDLLQKESLEKMVKGVVDAFGRIDVLINNAGVSISGVVSNIKSEDWHKVLGVNLTGSFNLLRLAAGVMMKQNEGNIINISSLLGLKGPVGACSYSVSKAALIDLGKSAAGELGRYNIRVNTVLPGFHKSSINLNNADKLTDKALSESLINCTTDPQELTDFIVFLAKTKSITGQVFNCDSRIAGGAVL